jgi:hypothetical protein
MSTSHLRLRLLAAGCLFGAITAAAAPPALADGGNLRVSVVSDALRVANVVPMWGAQIPKVVYDGRWFYAATLDGDGTQYPWQGHVWKSADGHRWTEAVHLPGHVYQPIGLLVDGAGRLHVQVACYTGAECFPGVAPAPGADMSAVYEVRLTLAHALADDSADFTRPIDQTVRTPGAERYYQGMAMDSTGRYLYTAYAVNGWDLYVNVFDTVTGTDVHTSRIGTPPAGRAWLYPRVQPGSRPGEVYLSFSQYVLGSPNSAYLDGATLWRSTDFGRSFTDQTYLATTPAPDGDRNWVDPSDITIDRTGQVHAIFYRRDNGVGTLYYQRGLTGKPVAVGALDNHSQILVQPDGSLIVFSSEGANLLVTRSTDGTQWNVSTHPVPGVAAAYWPNLLEARSGSRTPPGWEAYGRPTTGMLMAGKLANQPGFHPLLFVRFR